MSTATGISVAHAIADSQTMTMSRMGCRGGEVLFIFPVAAFPLTLADWISVGKQLECAAFFVLP